MTAEIENQTFLTALPDENQLKSFILSDDDDGDEIGVTHESLNDFEYKSVLNDESEEIIDTKDSPEISPLAIPTSEHTDVENKISPDNPSSPPVNENLQTTFTRSVYDYAAIVYGKSEDPHQNKLDHDVNAILGSSDPPPGFGFLHPKVYYLTQKRPIPLEPLRVWRGYNGHVYFVPIKVQHLESARVISPTKSRKSTAVRTAPASTKRPQRSHTISSEHRSRKSATHRSVTSKDRTNTNRSLSSHKEYAQTISSADELTNNTRTTFSEGEENKDEPKKMWRSVVTCMPAPKKPISKRSQYALEDMRAIKQKQLLQDPIGYNRPVLPNIRLIPKTKFLYKGLAYKEVKKIPGVTDENDDENSMTSLKRPLVDYNRTQAYVRHEVNVARTKQKYRQPPPASPTPTQNASNEQLTRSQTVLDLRETRKRIVKGTTVARHPASKRPGRTENTALPHSEVLLPIRNLSTLSHIPASSSSIVCTSPSPPPQKYAIEYTSPVVSQNFDVSSVDNVLAVQNVDPRPSTSKSSIPAQQINASGKPLLTKYVNRPRSLTRRTPTTELMADAS